MLELIPIQRNAQGEATVNARDLHAFLGVGKVFAAWIKDRIQKFGFVEGHDFVFKHDLSVPNSESSKARAQHIIEYHLSLDMAKELAMVERTAKGKEARQYFIACEKEYWRMVNNESAKPRALSISERFFGGLPNDVVLADFQLILALNKASPGVDENQAFLGAVGQMEAMGIQLRPLLGPQALALESPHRYAELRPTDIARRFGILRRDGKEDPAAVNRLLADLGFQTRTAKETLSWTPSKKGWPFAVVKDVPNATVQGGRPVRQLFWKETLLEVVEVQESFEQLGRFRMREVHKPQLSLELH